MARRKPKPKTPEKPVIPYCHPARQHVRGGLCAACDERQRRSISEAQVGAPEPSTEVAD